MLRESLKNIGIKNPLWSLVFVLFAAGICSAQSVLYFPQFVDGSQGGGVFWMTGIAVTNPAGLGTAAASGTLTFTHDDGTPMNIALQDTDGKPVAGTFQLAGGQTKIFLSPSANVDKDPSLPLNIGFATVTSNLPLTGASVFFENGPNGTIGVAGVPAAAPLTSQGIVAVRVDQANTAVAVANSATATASITFQLLDLSGTPIAPQVSRTLAANNHTAFYVSDLFPSAPPTIFGTMRITSDQPIVSTSLFFQGSNFATFPVFPLP